MRAPSGRARWCCDRVNEQLSAGAAGRCRQRRRVAVCKVGSLLGAHVLAAALWSGVANAERTRAVEPTAAPRARSSIIVAQTFHVRPNVPGPSDSGDLGRSPDGTHAPPRVPGSSDSGELGRASDGSHAPPPVPNFSGAGSASSGSHVAPAVLNGSGASHAAPGVPVFNDGASNAPAQSHAPSPTPKGTGASHAAPGVPMMGGNP
jgi:hypothetical protein